MLGGIDENVEELKADEFAGLDSGEMRFFPTGALELCFGTVETTDNMIADADHCVWIGAVYEVCVVVVPLEGL